MIKLEQAIVVEGKYDKNTLSQLVDAPIFETNGFGVMKDRALVALLRRAAGTRGLIVLTDSDGAGFVIRNYLKSVLPKQGVFHAYIPDVPGKERRKDKSGKEGKLGVEGMRPEVLLQALERAGVRERTDERPQITKTDLFLCGLSGGAGSARRRAELMRRLELPEHLGANAFLDALNLLMTREALFREYNIQP
ncbi:MAG: DUF4093 domain-containing protein [Candidatus Faecousia sp.]|uniref:toprim domain-containing protein n=1 Tax=Faecousia sp. TaxID=2952921 RepID=UPI002A857E70|nr:DUF4093 domain-containing protein [Candidatus Faecousia sp.]